MRVFIPTVVLVHACHHGIVAMKTYARSYLWRPGTNKDIEEMVGELM